MYDLHSEPTRRTALDHVFTTGQPWVTSLLQLVQDGPSINGSISRASGILFAPVMAMPPGSPPAAEAQPEPLAPSPPQPPSAVTVPQPLGSVLPPASIIGTISVVYTYDELIHLRTGVASRTVEVVVTMVGSNQYTFAVAGDGTVTNLGIGDLHSVRGQAERYAAAYSLRLASGQAYVVTVYPTASMFASYLTAGPRDEAIGVAVLIAGCAALAVLLQMVEVSRFKRLRAFHASRAMRAFKASSGKSINSLVVQLAELESLPGTLGPLPGRTALFRGTLVTLRPVFVLSSFALSSSQRQESVGFISRLAVSAGLEERRRVSSIGSIPDKALAPQAAAAALPVQADRGSVDGQEVASEDLMSSGRRLEGVQNSQRIALSPGERELPFDMAGLQWELLNLEQLCNCSHSMIVTTFGGAMLGPPGSPVPVLVQEEVGQSLEDLIALSFVRLGDIEFSVLGALALHINRGLLFLAESKPAVVANLSASNVIIDPQFSFAKIRLEARLQFYGDPMPPGKARLAQAVNDGELQLSSQRASLWTAPEALVDPWSATSTSDVYSFGMCLFELFTGNAVFSAELQHASVESLLASVAEDGIQPAFPEARPEITGAPRLGKGGHSQRGRERSGPPLPIAAQITVPSRKGGRAAAVPHELKSIIRDAWIFNPLRRPTCNEVHTLLTAALKAAVPVQDALEARLGNLALSQQVALLHNALPRHVVEALLRGEKVPPENHPNATVFFRCARRPSCRSVRMPCV